MGRTLHVITPEMHGTDVHAINHLLAGNNVFNRNFHPGPDDGSYGGQHGSAAKRAKEWLGYPGADCNTSAGDTLRAYLTGKAKLTAAMKARQWARTHQVKPLRVKALARMMSRHGLAESPQGSNKNWLVAWWYGNKNAVASWCMIDVSESYINAGSKAFSRGKNYAYVPYFEEDARRGINGLVIIGLAHLQSGDAVTFAWAQKGIGRGEHVGEFKRWIKYLEIMETEEGNTDSAGGANGGQQLTKQRPVSEVNVCIHATR